MVRRKLSRLTDWKSRLNAELDLQRTQPFQWGKNDCVLGMARKVVIALTGEDPTPEGFDPRYRSERGALKALRGLGYESLRDALGDYLEEVHPDWADAGDLALIEEKSLLGHAVGVVEGGTILVLTPNGHGRVPRERAITAFKV